MRGLVTSVALVAHIIDCDGTILQRNSWAWFGEGRAWWNLPLVPTDELHAFLDDYLADPPDCYAR